MKQFSQDVVKFHPLFKKHIKIEVTQVWQQKAINVSVKISDSQKFMQQILIK
jgi:hypothetical protein